MSNTPRTRFSRTRPSSGSTRTSTNWAPKAWTQCPFGILTASTPCRYLARGVLVPGVRGNALASGSGGRPVLRAESRRWHAPPRSRVWCPGPRGRGLTAVEAQGLRRLSLRGIARQVGIAAPSVYLHFPDLDLLLAAVVEQGFDRLTIATNAAAQDAADTAEALRARCRAYCHFALEQ